MPDPIEKKESKTEEVLNFFDLTQCPDDIVFQILLSVKISDIPNLFRSSKQLNKFDTDHFWVQRIKLDFGKEKEGDLPPKKAYKYYHNLFKLKSTYYEPPKHHVYYNIGSMMYAKMFME